MLLRLFKNGQDPVPSPILTGERLYLRPPEKRDAAAWIDARSRNHDFLKPWSPARAMVNITREGYLNRLAAWQSDWREGRACSFFIFLPGGELAGGVALNGILRGAAQMAHLGYWLDEAQTRKGYMTEAVKLACGFAFDALKLHRVEAGTVPENAASQKVLANCGFVLEGYKRRYLKIAGEWRDHFIFSLLAEDFTASGAADS